MKLKSSAFILVFLLPKLVFAGGNEVGNGGNAVVCKSKAELLDFAEAKVLRGVSPNAALIDAKADAFANAKARIEVLKKFDQKTGEILLRGLGKLKTDLSFETDINIKPIEDSLHSFTPKDPNCQIEQMVILRKHPLPGEKRVLANKMIWDEMDLLNRTGILLHETIYEYFAELGEKDSVKARYLVSKMLTNEFESGGKDAYWKLIKDLKIPIYH
jgi:hypothetical protein